MEIEIIKNIVRQNKYLSALCRLSYMIEQDYLIINVHQENPFSHFYTGQNQVQFKRFLKVVIKSVQSIIAKEGQLNSNAKFSKLFSVGSLTVYKNMIKINLVHGFLENYGKVLPQTISQHISCIIKNFVQNTICFANQIQKDNVLKETFYHFLGVLKENKVTINTLCKEHPLFLDSAEKITLLKIANDYNQQVLSKKYQNLNQEQLIMMKNIFVDQIEYWAFRERVDGSTDSNANKYNWIQKFSPELKELVIDFNRFKKENTKGTIALKEDRFAFQLRFVKNLIYHCDDYKEKCQDIFHSSEPTQIMKAIQQMFPRFMTFIYDFHHIQKQYFEIISKGKNPSTLKFSPRLQTQEQTQRILSREKSVFKAFYQQILVPQSKGDSIAHEKLLQLYYKYEFYHQNQEVKDWTKFIPLDEKLRKQIEHSVDQRQSYEHEMLRHLLYFKEIICNLEKVPSLKETWRKAIKIYMEQYNQTSIYSCLNLLGGIGGNLSEIESGNRSNQSDYKNNNSISSTTFGFPQANMKNEKGVPPPFPFQATHPVPPNLKTPLYQMPPPPNQIPLTISQMSLPISKIPFSRKKQSSSNPSEQMSSRSPSSNMEIFAPSKWPAPCEYYMQGRCKRNNTCKLRHPTTCEAHIRGICRSGKECPLFHIPNLCPQKQWIKCEHKRTCTMIHLPVCQDLIMDGSCHFGKRCRNYHPPVTLCNFSIKGHCSNPNCKFYHLKPLERNCLI